MKNCKHAILRKTVSKTFSRINIEVEYMYLLSDWFKNLNIKMFWITLYLLIVSFILTISSSGNWPACS